jgi:circadian clock protein KaiC
VHAFRAAGLTSIILAESAGDYAQLTTLGVEDYVCDLVIILRNVVDGERRRRTDRGQQVPALRPLQGRIPVHHHLAGGWPCSRSTPRTVDEPRRAERYSSGFPVWTP